MRMQIRGMILFLAISSTVMSAQSRVTTGSSECSAHTLPPFVQSYLHQNHDRWRIQEPEDLGPRAHERWEAEKPLTCPGIASGLFDDTEDLSYAILLVPTEQKNTGYKLVVFNKGASGHSYIVRIVDHSENANSKAFFIHKIGIGGFFDPQSKRKFRVQAQEGILFIDAGEREYEADVYFWGAGGYHNQPVDY